MKKFTYLATMLLVMAGVVSCEKKSDVKSQESKLQPTGEMREVSVAAGQGSAKTSVNNGVLTWSEGDKLYVAPTAGGIDAAIMNITSGVGTATGMFHGRVDSSITDETMLYGWTGGAWTYNDGAFTINMPATQTYVGNGLAENAYPSIGTGTIKGGVSLQNPFSVLCLNVKGKNTDAVKSITVTSSANNLAGAFTINPSTFAVSGGSSKTITLNCSTPVTLTSDGVLFFMVIPAASYAAKDLTVLVTKTDDAIIEVSLGAITVTAGNATDIQNVKEPIGRGEAERTGGVMVKWVQLWENGPKWAEYNVGAASVGEYGEYYSWGGSENMKSDDNVPTTIKIDIQYDPDWDTARKKWGNNWQMPKKADYDALFANCDLTRYFGENKYEGLNGIVLTGKGEYSDNSIFIPAAGYINESNGSLNGLSTLGFVHCSTPMSSGTYVYYAYFNSGNKGMSNYNRSRGRSVRAILHE